MHRILQFPSCHLNDLAILSVVQNFGSTEMVMQTQETVLEFARSQVLHPVKYWQPTLTCSCIHFCFHLWPTITIPWHPLLFSYGLLGTCLMEHSLFSPPTPQAYLRVFVLTFTDFLPV